MIKCLLRTKCVWSVTKPPPPTPLINIRGFLHKGSQRERREMNGPEEERMEEMESEGPQ